MFSILHWVFLWYRMILLLLWLCLFSRGNSSIISEQIHWIYCCILLSLWKFLIILWCISIAVVFYSFVALNLDRLYNFLCIRQTGVLGYRFLLPDIISTSNLLLIINYRLLNHCYLLLALSLFARILVCILSVHC